MPDILGTLKVPRLAAAPSAPVVGQMYYDTVANEVRWWNASAWIPAKDIPGGSLPADTVVTAPTRIIANKLLAGDANNAWRVMGDGKQEWGAGGATALDTTLYRSAADVLATDDTFQVNRVVGSAAFQIKKLAADAQPTFRIYGDGKMEWGSGGGATWDANLYDVPGSGLKMDSTLTAASGVRALYLYTNAGLASEVSIASGSIYFGSAWDASIFRKAANALRTPSDWWVDKSVVVDAGGAAAGGARLYFGSSLDASIYRQSFNELRMDGKFTVAGPLWVYDNGGTGATGIRFGTSADTNLYRSAADVLMTDDTFVVNVGQSLSVNNGTYGPQLELGYAGAVRQYRHTISTTHDGGTSSNNLIDFNIWTLADAATALPSVRVLRLAGDGKMWFGTASDTNLYRSGAGYLKTDGMFLAAGTSLAGFTYNPATPVGGAFAVLVAGESGFRFFLDATGKQTWGSGTGAADTNLYRAAAAALQTDGAFLCTTLYNYGDTFQDLSNTGKRMYWGSANDTYLSRLSAGVLGINGVAINPTGGQTLLSDVTITTPTNIGANISVPSTYRAIRVLVTGRSGSGGADDVAIQFNGDGAGNYDSQVVQGVGATANGSIAIEALGITYALIGRIPGSAASAGSAGSTEAVIYNYAGSVFHKIVIAHGGWSEGTGSNQHAARIFHARWRNTAAITSVLVATATGQFQAGSRITVYGVT